MTAAFRTLVHVALAFLAAAAIFEVFDVAAAPVMAILAIGAACWPWRRRRCRCCDD